MLSEKYIYWWMGLPSCKGLLQHFIKYIQFNTFQCLIVSYWHKYCYIYLIYRMENILARDHIIVLLFWSLSTVKECIQAFTNTRNLRQCFLDWEISLIDNIIYLKQLWIWLHRIFSCITYVQFSFKVNRKHNT